MDYEPDAVAALKQALEALPKRQRRKLSTREAIAEMADTISASLLKGYTQEEIAQLLTTRGIRVAPSTLRQYLRRHRGKARRKLRKADPAVGGAGGEAAPGKQPDTRPAPSPESGLATPAATTVATTARTPSVGATTFPYRDDDNDL